MRYDMDFSNIRKVMKQVGERHAGTVTVNAGGAVALTRRRVPHRVEHGDGASMEPVSTVIKVAFVGVYQA